MKSMYNAPHPLMVIRKTDGLGSKAISVLLFVQGVWWLISIANILGLDHVPRI